MSAIANFKKRREAQRAQQGSTTTQLAATPAPVNEALTLLAILLGCEPECAIDEAKALIETAERKGFSFVIGFDLADGKDETAFIQVDEAALAEVIATEKTLNQTAEPSDTAAQAANELTQSAANVEDAAAQVEDAAANVNAAAETVSTATGDLEETASQLAYSAEDIGQATAQLKEATEELKKPSAAQPSSRGRKAAEPKSS